MEHPNQALPRTGARCRSAPADGVPAIHAVDVFCGIGGLTYGLGCAGVQVKAGFDNDASCRYAFDANNPGAAFTEADVRDLRFSDFAPHYAGADVTALVGCAPCQPFSAHTRRARDKSADDCSLVYEFSRLVREGKPDLVSMENVPGLAKHDSFRDLANVLSELDYRQDFGVLCCERYGVPQRRRRLVMLARRRGGISLPPPTNEKSTVAQFIQDMPAIGAGETSADDPAHTTLPLTRANLVRIQQSKPGGSWRDWDQTMVNACHTRAHYPASYGRMRWDQPAPTITTQFCYYSTGRFGHPTQDRAISVREGALLQTFPRDYKLLNPKEDNPPIHKLARHLGNAVPVKIGEAIGRAFIEAVGGQ